jgi:site-specific recombinase XerD
VTRLTDIESVHVAAYIEQLQKERSAPTAKLRLAALRHLFDWMVIGQIMPVNPAAAVRGPRHIVRRGKTPVLDPAEARPQANAYAMIQRRAKSADILTRVSNHTFRATGVTAYLKNGGTLERAAQMANHASTRTTQLYDRRAEEVTLDEVERILV